MSDKARAFYRYLLRPLCLDVITISLVLTMTTHLLPQWHGSPFGLIGHGVAIAMFWMLAVFIRQVCVPESRYDLRGVVDEWVGGGREKKA